MISLLVRWEFHGAFLSVKDLRVWLHAKENLVKKVDGVDLSINGRETAGVVGEIGGRKTGLLLQFWHELSVGILRLMLRVKDENPVILLSVNSFFVCVGPKKEEEMVYSLRVLK